MAEVIDTSGFQVIEQPPVQQAAPQVQQPETIDTSEFEVLDTSGFEVISQPEPTPQEQPKDEAGIAERGLQGLVKLGEIFDSAAAGPTRAAVKAVAEGQDPLSAASGAFLEPVLGGTPAPTGSEVAGSLGIDETRKVVDVVQPVEAIARPGRQTLRPIGQETEVVGQRTIPSAADVAGVGIDIFLDPLAFIPIGKAFKLGVKGAGKASAETAKATAQAFDFVSGANTKDILKVAGEVKDSLGGLFKPSVAEDFNTFKKIAQKNNIDISKLPESVEFGPRSVISRAARTEAEGPLGAKRLEDFNKVQEQINNAYNAKATSLGGGGVPTKAEAGAVLRQAYDRGVDNAFNGIETSYKKISNANPGLALSQEGENIVNTALNKVEDVARIKSRGFTKGSKSQGKELIEAASRIRAAEGNFDLMVDGLRDLGEVAFKSSASIAELPSDVKTFRKLYREISQALITTVKNQDPALAKSLIENNKKMSKFFGEQSLISKQITNKSLSDEALFKSLIVSGDTKKIAALRNVFGEAGKEDFNKLAAAYLESIAKKGPEGDIKFRTIFNKLRDHKDAATLILGKDIIDVADITKLGDRVGAFGLSSSGTSAANAFRDISSTATSSLGNKTLIRSLKRGARSRAEEAAIKAAEAQDLNAFQRALKGMSPGPRKRFLKAQQVLFTVQKDKNEQR